MSHPFKAYEIEVLERLLSGEFPPQELSHLVETAAVNNVEYTNYGFYVSVQHPGIGKPRRVYNCPATLTVRCDGHAAGFIVFLENDKLTLEIFPYDGEALPATFRHSAVELTDEAQTQES